MRKRQKTKQNLLTVAKAGVWIDHRQAIVVLIAEEAMKIKKIASGIERPIRASGNSRSKHKYTPNDFIAEDKLERKFMTHLKNFYDEIISSVRDAQAILIIGPGEAKGEFLKRLKNKELHGHIVELETTDKMTERQLVAKVEQHFAKITVNKLATSKTTARELTKTTYRMNSSRM